MRVYRMQEQFDPWTTIESISGVFLGIHYRVSKNGRNYHGTCPGLRFKVDYKTPGECIVAITGEILERSKA